LANNIDKTKNLTKPVANSVHIVLFEVHQEVVDQNPLLDRTLFNRLQTRVQAQDNSLHKATFKKDISGCIN
jgi:hypothetical protein